MHEYSLYTVFSDVFRIFPADEHQLQHIKSYKRKGTPEMYWGFDDDALDWMFLDVTSSYIFKAFLVRGYFGYLFILRLYAGLFAA